jgi:hypothetical protein
MEGWSELTGADSIAFVHKNKPRSCFFGTLEVECEMVSGAMKYMQKVR